MVLHNHQTQPDPHNTFEHSLMRMSTCSGGHKYGGSNIEQLEQLFVAAQ